MCRLQVFEILAGSVGRIKEVRIRSGFELELRFKFIALGGPKRPNVRGKQPHG